MKSNRYDYMDTELNARIVNNIRHLCDSRGITMLKLETEMLHVPSGFFARKKRNSSSSMPVDIVMSLSKIFNVPINVIIYNTYPIIY